MEKKDTDEQNEIPTSSEPFNSAVDHYQKIMGMPQKRGDLRTFPKWLKYFYYFVATFVLLALLSMFLIPLLK